MEKQAQEIKRQILPTKVRQQEDCDFGFCDDGDEEAEESIGQQDEASQGEPIDEYGNENDFGDEDEQPQQEDLESENFQDIIQQKVNKTKNKKNEILEKELGELALKYADSDKENSQPVSKSKNSASQKSHRSNPFQKGENKPKDKTDAKFS